jgi:hypothetical protein
VLEAVRTVAVVVSGFFLGWWLGSVAAIVLLTVIALGSAVAAHRKERATIEPTSPTDVRNAVLISSGAAAVLMALLAIEGWLDLPGALLAVSAGVLIGSQLALSIRADRQRRDPV